MNPKAQGLQQLDLWVPGDPLTKGNHRLKYPEDKDRRIHWDGSWVNEQPQIVDHNAGSLLVWESKIQCAYWDKYDDVIDDLLWPGDAAIWLQLDFEFEAAGRQGSAAQRKWLRAWPARRDIDKLSRAVLDALSRIAYQDDQQVTNLSATKRWSLRAGVTIKGGRIIQKEEAA